MKLAIISAGRGSRLSSHLQGLPKCLASVAGKTALLRQYEWAVATGLFDEIAVVTHSAGKVQEFCKLNQLDIRVISHNELDGSGNACLQLPEHWHGESVLLHWCDVLVAGPLASLNKRKPIAFVQQGYGRYAVTDGQIVPAPNGDVAGLYFVPIWSPPNGTSYIGTPDFADVASHFVDNADWLAEPVDMVHFGDFAQMRQAEQQLANKSAKSSKATAFTTDKFGELVKLNRGCELAWFEYAHLVAGIEHLAIRGDKHLVMRRAEGSIWDKRYLLQKADALHKTLAEFPVVTQYPLDPSLTWQRVHKRTDNEHHKELAFKLHYMLPDSEPAVYGHFDAHFHNVLYIGDKLYPIDPGGDTFAGLKLGPRGYDLGKMLYAYMFWSPLYEGILDSLLFELLDLAIPQWLLENLEARVWCGLHCLAAATYFKHDYRRFLSANRSIERILDLLELL